MAFRRFILDLLGSTDPVDVGEIRFKAGTGFRAKDGSGVFTISAGGGGQPLDTDLTAIAALTSAADKVPYATGAGTWALATFTAAGRAIAGGADEAAQRTSLGLGTAATSAVGDFVGTLRVLTADVTLAADVSLIVSDYYEITSLLTLDINATATLEIIQ